MNVWWFSGVMASWGKANDLFTNKKSVADASLFTDEDDSWRETIDEQYELRKYLLFPGEKNPGLATDNLDLLLWLTKAMHIFQTAGSCNGFKEILREGKNTFLRCEKL
ncbi:MAG: hypothetical protein Q8M08_02740 [Bacteroidales bacterium]|nr:hypothetical protein [Bacteroidales bacterium]